MRNGFCLICWEISSSIAVGPVWPGWIVRGVPGEIVSGVRVAGMYGDAEGWAREAMIEAARAMTTRVMKKLHSRETKAIRAANLASAAERRNMYQKQR